ncbi:MAG: hypothetical protein MUO76_18005 [Anaerolineaceae bacterium]|nr:hypothetical protein [Anaerolineaceae bacterium]
MNPENALIAAIDMLQKEMGNSIYRTWLDGTKLLAYENQCFEIGFPSTYARDWCESRIEATLKRTLTGLMGETVGVQFTVSDVHQHVRSSAGPSPANTKKALSAWNSVLDILAQKLPKVDFETWVRNAEFGSFIDGVFSVRVSNRFTKEWLENRLANDIHLILSEELGESVNLQFSVILAGSQDETHQTQVQTGKHASRNPKEKRARTEYIINAAHLSLYDLLVKPEQEIFLPGYLMRWIPYLGPTLFMILVGFRQVYYLKNGCLPSEDNTLTARGDEIAHWTGLDERTFWRHFNKPLLRYFIRQDGAKIWKTDEKTGRVKRATNRYSFVATTPLTPGDAEYLHDWLQAAGCRDDPVKAIEAALNTHQKEILADPPPRPKEEHLRWVQEPLSVQDVVRIACGNATRDTLVEIDELGNKLSGHLMPRSDKVFLSWYFLRNWVSSLGPAAAMFITLMRDRCYDGLDDPRNDVWVSGGNQEIATRLGLPRAKTVNEWLAPIFERPSKLPSDPKKLNLWEERRNRREGKRRIMSRFVQRIGYRPEAENYAWHFIVKMDEPICPKHEEIYTFLLDVIGEYMDLRDDAILDGLIEELAKGEPSRARLSASSDQRGRDRQFQLPIKDAFVSFNQHENQNQDISSRARLSETNSNQGRDCQKEQENKGAPDRYKIGNEGAFVSEMKARLSVLKPLINTSIGVNSLNNYFNHLKRLTSTEINLIERGSRISFHALVVDQHGNWNLDGLLTLNHVSQIKREQLVSKDVRAEDFVAELIYAASEQGQSVIMPINHAIASVAKEKSKPVEQSRFMQLAELRPIELARLMAVHMSAEMTENEDWEGLMGEVHSERVKELAGYLGVEIESGGEL